MSIDITPSAREIVFVDGRVEDAGSLLHDLPPGAEIVFLKPAEDGLAQMAAALGERGDVGAVHILAHGSAGQLWLGGTFLDADTLAGQSEALAAIGRGMTSDGDLLVYACDMAKGEAGAQFVASLAQLTGADVAASNNRTGAGGDWQLEIRTGDVTALPVLAANATQQYHHDLATITVTSNANSGVGTLRQAISDAASGDTITFNAGMTVTLSGTQLTIGKNLTIDGDLNDDGTADVTVDANNSSRVFSINSGNTVLFDGLVITKGILVSSGGDESTSAANSWGAGIANSGTLTIRNSSITENKASGGGGGGGDYGGNYAGGGGGGGGFGTKSGGAGGFSGGAAFNATSASGITGGRGAGGSATAGGAGGGSSGGVGGSYSGGGNTLGYTAGGNGGTANNGSISIGGGGGGMGASGAGGAGGNAAAAIYNYASGTITILNSSITNNIAAGGGGGGGVSSYQAGLGRSGNGGAGGTAVGGIWNAGGTVRIDSTTNTSLSTGNIGAGGSGGLAVNGGSNGAAGSSTNTILNVGGTVDTNYTATTLTSATYDASTGVLSVTAAGMTTGDTIVVGNLTLTGQGGNTYTLTSSNVTASSATAFSVTLNPADQLAVNGLLNKNGTSAVGGTTFNLAGASSWDSTASAAADTTGNGVTVSNVSAPTITSATYNSSTHILTVTGTNLVRTTGATNDITVSTLTITGEGGTTRTLTSSDVEISSATSFAVTLNAGDQDRKSVV